jgi:hypothetical protein
MLRLIENLRLDGNALRYSDFVPQLYNYCLSLGFRRERMMPSRAFCSDETQGYPVILIAQHFGTFPFDHGLIGGNVALDRHGPHAHHGEDLVIIQASHVGYDPDSRRFGIYRRRRTASQQFGDNCGKLCAVLHWYQFEYRHACEHILCGRFGGEPAILIGNQFLEEDRREGLFLNVDRLIDRNAGLLQTLSTSNVFRAAPALVKRLPAETWGDKPALIGRHLTADLFFYRRRTTEGSPGPDPLETALAPAMPMLVTSRHPPLDAARYHTQVEFDRTYRSIRREPAYSEKNLLFISGINIDIPPRGGRPFPLTKFVPWAAYVRLRDGRSFHLEQGELTDTLRKQSADNPERMSFDDAAHDMGGAEEITIET